MMSEKEIDYFNNELKSQNMEIVESPEYTLIPSDSPGFYAVRFSFNGILMQSIALKTVREWSIELKIDINSFLISIQN